MATFRQSDYSVNSNEADWRGRNKHLCAGEFWRDWEFQLTALRLADIIVAD
jgi:hypothetical protein